MERKENNIFHTALLILIMLVSIAAYNFYIQQQIYYESTQGLLSTYGQVTKTFTMFAQRNWNILTDWSSYLQFIAEDDDAEEKWMDFIAQKATWQYSDFYLFNEDCQYWTTAGRQGTAEHVRDAFMELYEANAPMVSSYIASNSLRKVMFAVPMEKPITLDGVTYTALAVSYDNSALENMLGGMAYEGQSDCYIVRADGDVVLSTEPKTEITDQLGNLFDYLREHAQVDTTRFDDMLQTLPSGGKGSVLYRLNGTRYYLVYQPVGIKDWSIVGIVPTDEVDAGMHRVQMTTLLLLTVLGLVILAGVAKIMRDAADRRRELAETERRELERRKELSDTMFQGMACIVDRFAVCDLENDHYMYHERHGEELYPHEGSYRQLLEMISRRYVIMTDGENAKLTQMLAPDNLRKLLTSEKDTLKLEYAARDKSCFQMMTVVPMGWKEDRLTRVMMITQDMGEQHLLKSMANTDALTGLLNKRYFDTLLEILEKRQQRFALFYLDLDRFKPVNDTYGHEVGDKLLQGVSKRLQGCIRSKDYAFRLGGDEFALLIPGEIDAETCRRKTYHIQEMVRAPYEIDGNMINIGTSCGVAIYPDECPDAEQTRLLADQRMYENKEKNHAMEDHGLRV